MTERQTDASSASPEPGRNRRWFAQLRDDRGVAAVEFAIILPVMLGLYLSTVVTTKAYMATRKVALVARALADRLEPTIGRPVRDQNACDHPLLIVVRFDQLNTLKVKPGV